MLQPGTFCDKPASSAKANFVLRTNYAARFVPAEVLFGLDLTTFNNLQPFQPTESIASTTNV